MIELNITDNPFSDIENESFRSLFKIDTLIIQNSYLSVLKSNLFDQMALKYLHMDRNKINELKSESFSKLINLTNLSVSYNQLNSVKNDTFIYLINLESLTLSHNKIEYIELHGFNGLNNLKFLSLNNNKLKTLQINNQSIFENLVNLKELNLEANQLNSIKSSYFLPLKRLEILNIKSDIIRIVEPNSFDSFSHLRRLFISIPNISNENIFNIKNSFKPVVNRSYVLRKYYSVTHIENRVNIDCSKTLYFMKSKILYNFFNEHIDNG